MLLPCPNMEHLGDIKNIDGGKIEPCELVTWGFPCTDISCAGHQEGIFAERSGLFFEAVRVIREMLDATDGAFPSHFLVENVPNLLSIHGGKDWQIVMDELAKLGFIVDPVIWDAQEFNIPQRRKRIYIVGVNRRYYNPLDFADVPNARDRRMQKAIDAWTALGDGTDENGLTFKRETFHGIASRPHEVERKKLSEILEHNVDPKYYLTETACRGILRRVDAKGKVIPELLRNTLEAQAGLFNCGENGGEGGVLSFEPGATARLAHGKYWNDIAPTLVHDAGDNRLSIVANARMSGRQTATFPIDTRNATRAGGEQGVGVGEDGEPAYTVTSAKQGAVALSVTSHPQDSRVGIDPDGLTQVLTARAGTGGGNTPLCAEPLDTSMDNDGMLAFGICSAHSNSMNSQNPNSGVYKAETAKTLDTSTQGAGGNQGGLVVCEPSELPTYCYEANAARPSHLGNGVCEGVSHTLRTQERMFVSYSMTTGSFSQVNEEQSPCLCQRDFKDAPLASYPAENDNAAALPTFALDRASANMGANALYKPQIDIEGTHSLTAQGPGMVSAPPSYIVRRLTPTECLVLMDLPRNWADNIAVANPTEDDYVFWEGMFATLGKNKSRKQIASWLKRPYSDSNCYRMAGNGVCLGVVRFIMAGIADHYNRSVSPR